MFTFMNDRQTYTLIIGKNKDNNYKLMAEGYNVTIETINQCRNILGIEE